MHLSRAIIDFQLSAILCFKEIFILKIVEDVLPKFGLHVEVLTLQRKNVSRSFYSHFKMEDNSNFLI